jgi:hypothetical protein
MVSHNRLPSLMFFTLKQSGSQLLLVFLIVDVNLLDDNIDTMKKNTETLIDANKEVGLELSTEKTRYMLLSCHRNAGQNHDIKLANRSSENVAQLKYLGTTVTDQNLIQREVKRRLNSGNACCHSVQKLLSSCLQPKSINIRIYKSIILSVVLYGRETWSLTLREERRLRVFENGSEENIWAE